MDSQRVQLDAGELDRAWQTLQKAMKVKLPAAAGTYGDDDPARYQGTGIYADHSYSILACREDKGTRYVTLRNPWGESEPAGNGANDGIFELEFSKFAKLYQSFETVTA